MLVEIVSAMIRERVVYITAIDVSEEHLQRIERSRDDVPDKDIDFVFDTKDFYQQKYIYKWLKRQKVTENASTWGEALRNTQGTIVTISSKYRVFD